MDNMQMQKPVKKFNIAFLILLVVIAPIWVYTKVTVSQGGLTSGP